MGHEKLNVAWLWMLNPSFVNTEMGLLQSVPLDVDDFTAVKISSVVVKSPRWSRKEVDMPIKDHLAVIETQKVKSYVFASPAMREIRGASLLLDRINRMLVRQLLENWRKESWEEIYLGGGSGRVMFENAEQAWAFCRAVEKKCHEETINARIVGEVVSRKPAESYAKLQGRGLALTSQRKVGRSEPMAQIAGRWIRPCSSCGILPAEQMVEEHGLHHLCAACCRKRAEVNNLYANIKKGEQVKPRPLKKASQLKLRYGEHFIFTTLAQEREALSDGETFLPQDFRDIGIHSRPGNYMAFIYADGNGMGEVLRKMGTLYPDDEAAKAAYRAFSEIVDQACRKAAVEAVLKHVPMTEIELDTGPAKMLPAEFIMAGGDDLMLVVPAHCALEVSADFLDLYQDMTRRLQDEWIAAGKLSKPFARCGLTSSAGVVVAHDHYPVRHLMELAADLMKLAKHRVATEHMREPIGTLDFMVISDSSSGRVKERRVGEYAVGSGCSLTARPYTTEEALKMVELIRALKMENTPRTKMKKLYASVFQSPLQAQYDGLRIRERLVTTGALDKGGPLGELFGRLSAFPFEPKADEPQSWQTPLSEIVEFYDYIQPK